MNKKYLFVCVLLIIAALIIVTGCVQQVPDDLDEKKADSDTLIEISASGGGTYGGINPVVDNTLIIKSDGHVTFSKKQFYDVSLKDDYYISRQDVEELAEYIMSEGFFEMEDVYDCSSNNTKCENRKNNYPPATPLTINVTIGDMNKAVEVTVHEDGMVEYPKNFDRIYERIGLAIEKSKQ